MYQSNRMHDAVVSKLAASRGSPCDSMASCYYYNYYYVHANSAGSIICSEEDVNWTLVGYTAYGPI